MYPYMKDVINDTLASGERLFLSHFTGSTHHPWGTPKNFGTEDYFPQGNNHARHGDLNAFLNTVRYVDKWLGQMLQLLEETGIANETLMVFVGDQ